MPQSLSSICVHFAAAFTVAAAAQRVGADTIPPCPIAPGVEEHSFTNDVPLALKRDLDQRIGQFVMPGEAFDNTDVVITRHNRRLIFVRAKGTRWVVATEHGSAGYNDPIYAYDIPADGSTATFVAEATALPLTVCKTAGKLLGVD